MRRLILMRHAKSSWDHPTLSDFERPLNKRGQRSAAALGDWLRAQAHLPEAAVVSAATRTIETFQGLGLAVEARFTSSGLSSRAWCYRSSPQGVSDPGDPPVLGTLLCVSSVEQQHFGYHQEQSHNTLEATILLSTFLQEIEYCEHG